MECKELTRLYVAPEIDKFIDQTGRLYNDGHMEDMLGMGKLMPCEAENSAARKNMHASQYNQHVCLTNPEVAYVSTAYENHFGHHSSSYVVSDRNWRVIGKVEKFTNKPGHHYYLFVIDDENNLDVIERVGHKHTTETYGYLNDNTFLDKTFVGATIPKGITVKKSKSFDEFDNYRAGVNLNSMYVSDARTTEDAVQISRFGSIALSRTELKTITILINDNDIPLNLYGDNNSYKIIPDIGEYVKNGILCGTRTEKNDESFFTQSAERLKRPMINDVTFKSKGNCQVVDINVYSNKDISSAPNGIYEGQLAFYANDSKRFAREVVDLLRNYIRNSDYKKSFMLTYLYERCESVVRGRQYFKDNVFSNIIVEVTLYRSAPLEVGDKITNRYGGKGVISKIIEDHLMPRNAETGERVDVIWNIATCVNRLNPGQLFELSLNFISANIVRALKNRAFGVEECIETVFKLYHRLSPELAQAFLEGVNLQVDDNDALECIASLLTPDMDGIYLPLKPISEQVTFNDLLNLYKDYPWIKPVFLEVPVEGSRGQVRFVKSQKPCIVAKQYTYRMKQNAEEKHSATAMSSTDVKGLNVKSKASKMYIRIHSNTPIRFGEMEGNIFKAMGAEIDCMNMMIYANSPIGRRDAAQMLHTYKFDVQLSEDAKSRSAEMLNCILKTMGLKFTFKKIPIKYGDVFKTLDDHDLFAYLDPANDKLFVQVTKDEQKLFAPVQNSEQLLFEYQAKEEGA